MLRVKLYTAGNQFVAAVIVVPFQKMPEAIMWGQRTFLKDEHGRYVEGLMVVAWTEEELANQGRSFRATAIQAYQEGE